jgi:hypothetical protein
MTPGGSEGRVTDSYRVMFCRVSPLFIMFFVRFLVFHSLNHSLSLCISRHSSFLVFSHIPWLGQETGILTEFYLFFCSFSQLQANTRLVL